MGHKLYLAGDGGWGNGKIGYFFCSQECKKNAWNLVTLEWGGEVWCADTWSEVVWESSLHRSTRAAPSLNSPCNHNFGFYFVQGHSAFNQHRNRPDIRLPDNRLAKLPDTEYPAGYLAR